MSAISTANILTSRTRSGRAREGYVTPPVHTRKEVPTMTKKARKEAAMKRALEETEMMRKTQKEAEMKEEAKEDKSIISEYERLFENATRLYGRQLFYIKNPNGREEKYKIMAEGALLIAAIKQFIDEHTHKSKEIEDVQLWVELACWNMRVAVFQQTIAVL